MNLFAHAYLRLRRDPRRTMLQAFGIGLVCALLIAWSTLSSGFSHSIYQTATRLLLGQIQIHHPKFMVSESIYDRFEFTEDQRQALSARGLAFTYRLASYALASSGEKTKGVRLLGLDPSLEAQTTDLPRHLAEGRFLQGLEQKEAVVGFRLAETLGLTVGGELIILGSAADGSMASDILRVVGILKPAGSAVDSRTVYVGSSVFRELFVVPEGVHELIVSQGAKQEVYEELGVGDLPQIFPDASVKTWRESQPQLSQVLDVLRFATRITQFFVFVALGMLILNLKLMSSFDRSREYGVMMAIGLHPRQLVGLIVSEGILLALVAAVIATLIGLPAALWIETHGIDFRFLIAEYSYASVVVDPVLHGYFTQSQILIPLGFLLLTLPLASTYPALVAARFQPKDAIHGKGSGV